MTAPNKSLTINNSSNHQNHSNQADDDAPLLDDWLTNIRIVMVNTTLPANIGSAARAMLTMGLTDLFVVNPKHPIDDTSISHAAGAKGVLDDCQVVETLEQAIADCQLVFAASSRQRHIPRPVVTPDQAAQLILQRHSLIDATKTDSTGHTKVAVLFGREDRGLTNDELALADYHIQIDANPNYPVLNVASAVQVISSFFYSRFLQHEQQIIAEGSESIEKVEAGQSYQNQPVIDIMLRQLWDTPAINQQQKLSLQSRIIELMHTLDLVESTDTQALRDLPSRLSRLLSRLQLDQKEYELLNAIIAKVALRL